MGEGGTRTLTAGVDNLPGTAGNDTFIGDSGSISAADVIDGGAGTDRANLFLSDDESLNSSNVENFFIQSSASNGGNHTFTASNVTGAEQIWSNRSSSALTVDAIQNNVTLGLLDTDATFNANFRDGVIGSDATLNVATNASEAEVDVDAGGATDSFTTLSVAAVAGRSVLTFDDAAAYTTINTSGEGFVSLAEVAGGVAEFGNVTAVNLNAEGGSTVNLGANAQNVAVTGSAADETVIFGNGQFNTNDTVALGEGNDTLVLGDANLAQAANANLTQAINAASGVEVLATSANADVQINAARYADISNFATTAVVGGTAATGADAAAVGGAVAAADATAAVNVTGIASSGDALNIQNNLTGGNATAGVAGGDNAGNAAAGLDLNMGTDGASDSFSLSITENAVTIAGGQGVAAGAGATAGTAGFGIDARQFETLNIDADENLTVNAGVANGGTAAAADTLLGANATVTITGDSDVDLGTVASNAGANFENLTINAAALEGSLTLTTGAGNDTITVGSEGSNITAGGGVDSITLGAGVDTVQLEAGDSQIGAMDTVTGFQGGTGGDVIDFDGANAYEALTGAQTTAVSNANDLTEAAGIVADALNDAANNATFFEFDGKVYAFADLNDSGTYTVGDDAIVELVGADLASLTAANIA